MVMALLGVNTMVEMNQTDSTDVYTRETMPLDIGDEVVIEGQPATYVDWPTDGPQFDLETEPEPFNTCQMPPEEFSEMFNNGDIEAVESEN